MKKLIITILLGGFLAGILSACGGGYYGGGRPYFQSHYGYGSWRGHPRYIDHRPIIIPPDGGGGGPEAVQLPEPSIDIPGPEAVPMDMDMDMDMGMPEIDIGM